jgi:hypothetical protein
MLWQKSQRLHPFSILMEPDSEAIVCDNSIRFPEGAFIRIVKRIMRIIPLAAINICPVIPKSGNDREGWMPDQSLPRT